MCKPIPVCYTVQRATVSVTDFSLLHSAAGKGLCHRFQSATQHSGQRSLSPISFCYTVQRAKVSVTIRPVPDSRGARCLEAAELSSGWPCADTAAPSTKTPAPSRLRRQEALLASCSGIPHPGHDPIKGPLGRTRARNPKLPLIQDFKDMELRLGQEWAAAPRVFVQSCTRLSPPLPRMMNSNGVHLLAVLEQ